MSISGPTSGPASEPVIERAARLEHARARMAAAGIDALLLSVGTDLPYLLGYEAMASERLTMAVIPLEGRPTLLVPELEAPRVDVDPTLCDTVAWGETEQPIDLVADRLAGVGSVAIGDHTWTRFLLALQECGSPGPFQSGVDRGRPAATGEGRGRDRVARRRRCRCRQGGGAAGRDAVLRPHRARPGRAHRRGVGGGGPRAPPPSPSSPRGPTAPRRTTSRPTASSRRGTSSSPTSAAGSAGTSPTPHAPSLSAIRPPRWSPPTTRSTPPSEQASRRSGPVCRPGKSMPSPERCWKTPATAGGSSTAPGTGSGSRSTRSRTW